MAEIDGPKSDQRSLSGNEMLAAAERGDVAALRRFIAAGVPLDLEAAAKAQLAAHRGQPAREPVGLGERGPDLVGRVGVRPLDGDDPVSGDGAGSGIHINVH